MNVDAALRVLGLTGTPTEAEIRRAYLRQVKAHPPERDAEGFQLVRAAYDLLKQVTWSAPEELFGLETKLEPVHPIRARESSAAAPEQREAADPWSRAFSDDAVEAADALIAIYERPLAESGALPPPFIALRCCMTLISLGRFERAKELLDVFDARVSKLELAGRLGADLGARWRLAQELERIARFDQALAIGLANAFGDGDLQLAADDLKAAHRTHGQQLGRYMRAHAPILWASVGRLVEPTVMRKLARNFKWVGWFPGLWLVLVFNLVRVSSGGCDHSTVPTRDTNAEVAPIPSTIASAFAFALSPNQVGTWTALKSALDVGDCQTVREQWPLYQRAQRDVALAPEVNAARKSEILTMCAELAELLEEKP